MLDATTPVVYTLVSDPPAAKPVATIPPQSPPEPVIRPDFAWTMLARHGRRPLGFQGHLLVQAASRAPSLPVWSELAVHETEQGTLVGAIRHVVRDLAGQPVGTPFQYAEACGDPAALLDWFYVHDPVADLPAETLLGRGDDPVGATRMPGILRDAWQALLTVTFGAGAGIEAADPFATPTAAGHPQ